MKIMRIEKKMIVNTVYNSFQLDLFYFGAWVDNSPYGVSSYNVYDFTDSSDLNLTYDLNHNQEEFRNVSLTGSMSRNLVLTYFPQILDSLQIIRTEPFTLDHRKIVEDYLKVNGFRMYCLGREIPWVLLFLSGGFVLRYFLSPDFFEEGGYYIPYSDYAHISPFLRTNPHTGATANETDGVLKYFSNNDLFVQYDINQTLLQLHQYLYSISWQNLNYQFSRFSIEENYLLFNSDHYNYLSSESYRESANKLQNRYTYSLKLSSFFDESLVQS